MEHLLTIVTSAVLLVGLVTANLYIRRVRRSEIHTRESVNRAIDLRNETTRISNAERMIELVKKANREALDSQREIFRQKQELERTIRRNQLAENRKLKQTVKRLEESLEAVKPCNIPVKRPSRKHPSRAVHHYH